MTTSFEVADKFYSILNVSSLTDEIQIYLDRRPTDLQEESVTVIPLTNQIDNIQNGYLNINIHAKDNSDGTPDSTRLQALTTLVRAALDDYASGATYFAFRVTNQELLSDERGWSYVNLRIEFFTE